MPGGIRGQQIKDDSLTGDDIDESTLVLPFITDADGDTTVHCEESGDEDKIRFDTAGVQRVVITQHGLMGIGTNDPDNTLHISSSGDTHLKIQSDDGSYAALKMKSGTSASTYVWTPADTSDIRLYAGGADRVHVDNDGNVGIGTTDPDYNLHLASATSAVMLIDGADNTDAFLRFGQGGTLKSYIKHGSGGHLVMTNETADKDIIFNIKDGAISREGLRLNGNVAEVVVNEGSNSLVDFRVESNNHTHMLFVDGSSDNVGVGTSAPGSALHVNASFATAISGTTSDYTLTGGDHTILVDCSSGNVTLTLPTAVGCAGRMYIIKRIDGSANAANVNSDGSEEIEGSASPVSVFPMSSIVIQSDNSGWWKVAESTPPPP